MKTWITLATLIIATTATAGDIKVSEMQMVPRRTLLEALRNVVPGYTLATKAVLKDIDALPKGTVTENTRLSEVPGNLFEKHQEIIRNETNMEDIDFVGGREDHTVAWLRESLLGLQDLGNRVKRRQNIDELVSVMSYRYISDVSYDYQVILEPVSRFYCNVEVLAEYDSVTEQTLIRSSESCD